MWAWRLTIKAFWRAYVRMGLTLSAKQPSFVPSFPFLLSPFLFMPTRTSFLSSLLTNTVVPAGTRDVPAGEALAVLVYEEKDIDAFKQFPCYHGKGGEGGGEGGAAVAAEGDEDTIAVDGVTLLKFLHKLARNGSIKDKGEKI